MTTPVEAPEYTAADAHAAVARGAAWLDEKCPDWAKEIDLGVLDMVDGSRCILGQTAECLLPDGVLEDDDDGFFAVLAAEEHVNDGWAQRLGFDTPHTPSFMMAVPIYEMLQIAWMELIRQRLEAQS